MDKTTKIVEIIEATEIKTEDGKKFWAYKTVLKNGKIATLKFTRKSPTPPTEKGFIEVPIDSISIDKSRRYLTVWIDDILNFFKEDPNKAEKIEKNRKEVEEAF